MTALRSLGMDWSEMSETHLLAWVTKLEREIAPLKTRVETADCFAIQLRYLDVGLFMLMKNLHTAFATSRTDVERPNGGMSTVSDELSALSAEVTFGASIQEVQQLVTDLDLCVEDTNVKSEMYLLCSQLLDDCIVCVVKGAIRTATLITAAVFEDVADHLNVWIPQIILCHNVMGKVTGEDAYREFENNTSAVKVCEDGERPPNFQVTR